MYRYQVIPKTLQRLLLLIVIFSITLSETYAQSPTKTLTILNWSEYFDPEIILAFEKKYNVKVDEVFYETDDDRDNLLLQTNAVGYDLGIVSGIMVDTYQKMGWLAPITTEYVENLKYTKLEQSRVHQGTEGYTVPFTWGILGIAYREDLVEKPIDSWMDLLQPQNALKGQILMVKGSREIIGIALKALGYSINSLDKNELLKAEALLQAQKPFVKRYGYMSVEEEGELVTGSIAAATTYNGDALSLQEYNSNIKFVLPEEGGELWVDHWVVFSSAKNRQLAYQFLNFINQPEIAAKNAEYVYMAPANTESLKYVSQEFLDNSIIFPSIEQLERYEVLQHLEGRTLRTRSRIFNKIVN